MAENDAHTRPSHSSDGDESDSIFSESGQIARTSNTPIEFGAMTQASGFFSDNYPDFSQKLAGAAMTSPSPSFPVNNQPDHFQLTQNIPAGSMVSDSQHQEGVLIIPPGLSPDCLLDSPDSFAGQGPFGMSNQQALDEVTAEANFHMQDSFEFPAELQHELGLDLSGSSLFQTLTSEPMQHNVTSCLVNTGESSQPCSMIVHKPPDDGYSWRKREQNQVQESEVSQSYYKCTARSCPVRRKVELSLDGQVMKIFYKNEHNHPPPPRLSKDGGIQGTSGLASQSERITQEQGASHRRVTEPQIMIQTTSEVDLLDDGYRWHKYGHEYVQGNPNLRSSYRCTYQGCNVRKHIERVATDPKEVLTTYEGRHNHDVPAARNL